MLKVELQSCPLFAPQDIILNCLVSRAASRTEKGYAQRIMNFVTQPKPSRMERFSKFDNHADFL